MRSEISSPLHFWQVISCSLVRSLSRLCGLGTWVVIPPYSSLFVDDAVHRWRSSIHVPERIEERSDPGFPVAPMSRLHNVLALRVPAEMARPRTPHVSTVALNVFVHRIGPPSTPVISLFDRQFKRIVMALVIEETVPDDSAIDPLRYPRAVFYEYDFVPSKQEPMDVNTHGLWTCCPLAWPADQ